MMIQRISLATTVESRVRPIFPSLYKLLNRIHFKRHKSRICVVIEKVKDDLIQWQLMHRSNRMNYKIRSNLQPQKNVECNTRRCIWISYFNLFSNIIIVIIVILDMTNIAMNKLCRILKIVWKDYFQKLKIDISKRNN